MRHTDLTNRTAFGLVQACLEAEVPLSVLLAQSVDDQCQRAGAILPDAGAPLGHGGRARGRLREYAGAPYTAVGCVSRRGVSWRAPRASPAAGAACGPPCPACVLAGWPQAPQRGGVPGGVALGAPPDPSAMGVLHVRFFLVFPRAR